MMALTLGCLCFTASARAQDQESADDPQQPQIDPQPVADENHEGDMERRRQERPDRRRDRGPKTYNLDRLERAMKKELDLDEEQIEIIEDLFEQRRAEYAEELAGQKDRMYEQREKMGEFLEKIREARRTGDRETEEEINDQIRTLHESVRVAQISDEFLEDLEKELYEDQIETFRRISTIGRSRPNLQEAARQRPGMLKRYVMRLDLDEYTSADIEELYEEVQEDMRSGRLPVAERKELANEFYEQVMELLDEDQKARLMKFLGADARRSKDPAERPKEPRRAQDRDRDEGADYDEEVQEDYEEPGDDDPHEAVDDDDRAGEEEEEDQYDY
jgi:hypothetical protein